MSGSFWCGAVSVLGDDGSVGTGLSPAGIVIMLVSIGSIVTLLVWCYRRLLWSDRPR